MVALLLADYDAPTTGQTGPDKPPPPPAPLASLHHAAGLSRLASLDRPAGWRCPLRRAARSAAGLLPVTAAQRASRFLAINVAAGAARPATDSPSLPLLHYANP